MREEYAAKELCEILRISMVGLYKKANREGWPFRDAPNPRGGGVVRMYVFAELPADIRKKIISSELGEAVGSARGAAPTVDELQEHLRARRIDLGPEQVMDPVVQGKILCARAVEEAAWGDKGTVIAALAKRYGKTEITIRRWVDEVEGWRVQKPGAGGSVVELSARGGAPGPRIELPATKKFAPEALAYGIQVYAQNLRSGQKAAYAALCKEAARRGWTIGDYSNFTRAVGKIPQGIWDGIRKGWVGFEKDYIPKILRAWLKVPVMTVLCGDQHIFDYQVFDAATNEVMTPECYVWMDCTSRYWAGVWPEFGHYNSFTLGHSLREACRFGIPDEVFTDWGKPENGKHIAQLVEGLSGYASCGGIGEYRGKYDAMDAAADGEDDAGDGEIDGVRHRRAQAGVPWLKPIENQFNVLERDLADRFLAGYRKRDADAWVNKTRNAELKRARVQGRLLSIEEFLEVFWDVVKEHNMTLMRPKERPEGVVPQEVFFGGLAEQSRTALDDRTLDYLCLPRYSRMSRQSVVEVTVRRGDRRGYYSPMLSGRKDKVWVSVDPYDLSAPAIICDLEGRYIDLAEPWNVQDPKDTEGLREKLTRQAELRRWWREQLSQVRSGFGLGTAGTKEPGSGRSGTAPTNKVVRISGASHVAKRAAEDAEARSLKPKYAEAGKRLEAMFDAMMKE
jgi:hypothetical protein